MSEMQSPEKVHVIQPTDVKDTYVERVWPDQSGLYRGRPVISTEFDNNPGQSGVESQQSTT